MTSYLGSFLAFPALALAGSLGLTGDAPRCGNVQTAQLAPKQDGVPEQKWCCCGSCCNWAISCDAIPGCSSC